MRGDAFAAATLGIVNDPAMAEHVSRGAQILYQNHLSWQRIGDRLLAEI